MGLPLADAVGAAVGEVEPDGLELGILVMGMNRVVASAKAGLLVAAEGRGDVALAETVHGDGAGAQGARAAYGALGVGSEDRRGESVFRVIGHCDGLVEAFYGAHRQHGTNDF